MTREDFDKIIKTRIDKTQNLLIIKGWEYAEENEDRLINFKDGAKLQHCTQKQCLLGYATKHIVALVNFIEQDAMGIHISPHQWDEKIGDIIAYMHILETMVAEDNMGLSPLKVGGGQ